MESNDLLCTLDVCVSLSSCDVFINIPSNSQTQAQAVLTSIYTSPVFVDLYSANKNHFLNSDFLFFFTAITLGLLLERFKTKVIPLFTVQDSACVFKSYNHAYLCIQTRITVPSKLCIDECFAVQSDVIVAGCVASVLI